MGKIHIKGGSPLRSRFEEDDGTPLKNLKFLQVGNGPLYEVELDNGNKIMANPRTGGGNIFQVAGSSVVTIDVQYES